MALSGLSTRGEVKPGLCAPKPPRSPMFAAVVIVAAFALLVLREVFGSD